MPMKDGALNCVAQRVIEHFEKAKRGYGLTITCKQNWHMGKKNASTWCSSRGCSRIGKDT